MRPRHLYFVLCLIGTLLPLAAFLPFLRAPGAGPELFLRQLFATPVSGFFGWDVIVSSLVLWTFVLAEGRRLAMARLWAPAAAQPDSRARATVARGIGQDEVMVGQGETRPAPSK